MAGDASLLLRPSWTTKAAALAVSLACGACATPPSHNIAFEEYSATLYIEAADGTRVAPLGGDVLSIDGEVGIGPDALRLTPGRHHLGGVHCPPPETIEADETGELSHPVASHGWPISHDFEIGKAYLLRCVDGYPEIVPYEPAR